MTNQQRSTLKQRLLPFTAAALTLGAMVAFSQLSTNVGSASAMPATPDAAPLAAATAPGNNVITNNNPGATAQYWTKAKAQSAKELRPTRPRAATSRSRTGRLARSSSPSPAWVTSSARAA